jgi:hypothetical protein
MNPFPQGSEASFHHIKSVWKSEAQGRQTTIRFERQNFGPQVDVQSQEESQMKTLNVVCAITALALGGISLTGCVVAHDDKPDVEVVTPGAPGPPGPQGAPGPSGPPGQPGPSGGSGK